MLCPTVPVGGPATMSFDYDIGENYAVIGMRLYCQAAKGSHPRYQWFRNKMLLHNKDSFYIVDQLPERSILLLSVGLSSAGTYHCEVSDSFDNSTVIRSKKLYIDWKGSVIQSIRLFSNRFVGKINKFTGCTLCLPPAVVNRVPLLIQLVVFGGFTFLVLLVSLCCWAGVQISECSHCCLCWGLPITN